MSPVSAAGLSDGDHVIAIDGQPISGNGCQMWQEVRQGLQPGQPVRLLVSRPGVAQTQTLTVIGGERQRECVLYYHWQFIYAGVCIVFLVLIVARQILRSPPTLWTPFLLVLTSLTGAAFLLLCDWRISLELYYQRLPVDNFSFPWVQLPVCVTAAVGLAALGMWELGAALVNRRQGSVWDEKTPDAVRAESSAITDLLPGEGIKNELI